jgi:hypothetical protein
VDGGIRLGGHAPVSSRAPTTASRRPSSAATVVRARVKQTIAGDTITYDTAGDTLSSTGADRRAVLPRPAAPARRVTVVFAPRVTAGGMTPAPPPEGALTPR